MFLGRHEHNLDDKGRLAIPSRFRESLRDGVVLTRGIDRCIAAYPRPAWDILATRVNGLSMTDPHARQFRRMVFAEAVDLKLDSQGRVLVPASLREYGEIEREAIIIGVHASIEIWSPDRWSAVDAALASDGDEIAARLAEML
ncbi:MAG: Cell division protein MraZ [uncultured Thermomicrobiales bacterium]|uniref:Transcriptional regulator MraZ n=1 Tax=uncultured Thermomicrobiales bacterium TaxID=1645740 RepID=A0A6J4UHX6_9BACT|nr:MAG: Cell division protein MraZ [uncultured Thermomicrobiales bacterium]